jgi:NTE family protein
MAKRGLVIGGGGPEGIAWEVGLISGLADARVDLNAADVLLGTSAGSFVGSLMAVGEHVAYAEQLMAKTVSPAQPSAQAPSQSQFPALLAALHDSLSGSLARKAALENLAGFAVSNAMFTEENFIKLAVPSKVAEIAWPARKYLCTAVDCEDGARKVWSAIDDVSVARAVASSCAVPGLLAPITINGRRYMDGGLLSPTNADAITDCEIVLVVAALPYYEYAEQVLERELAELRAGGAVVEVVRPDLATLNAYSPSLMDLGRQSTLAKTGFAQAATEAAKLRAFWR